MNLDMEEEAEDGAIGKWRVVVVVVVAVVVVETWRLGPLEKCFPSKR